MSIRVQEVGHGSDKKRSRVSDPAANRLSSYLHRSIANPATQKSTELNLGLKELTPHLYSKYCPAIFINVDWLLHYRAFVIVRYLGMIAMTFIYLYLSVNIGKTTNGDFYAI